ncbi:DUF86 domain-containing protein [Rhizobium deserti]|uniref:DUF86 domain-containing protein n=1 Tax=Rhizobium deserti TaxID=2547961 RepID=A0A4R5UMJ7_9HYPH|nr:HepT-like ribonuclease domain-containing protein [Rhizobium deserti]TDK39112.1 DUF86 domain-containing protein [Rhizobium deserti]
MTNTDRLKIYIDQMRTAALRAREFVEQMSNEEFLDDVRTQMAVGMAFVLIGEAASRIMTHYPDFPIEHPEILWTQIKGMRNFVVHDYYKTELPILLGTVRTSLQALVSDLDALRNIHAQGE